MGVKVLAGVGVVPVPMRLAFQCNRNEAHLTVRDGALCNYAIGEVSHSLGFSTKHCHFETAFMVEMHMQRCDMEVMVIVVRAGKPLWSAAPPSIIANLNGERTRACRCPCHRWWLGSSLRCHLSAPSRCFGAYGRGSAAGTPGRQHPAFAQFADYACGTFG